MVGPHRPNTEFHNRVIHSFVSRVFVDTMAVSDIRAMIIHGGKLFPRFIEPVLPKNIDSTIASMSPKKIQESGGVENALIKELTLRIIDDRTSYEYCGFLDKPSAAHELPYLAKMLLLAAFVCQHNKQAVDRQLFDPSRNGKRRAQRKGATDKENGDEDKQYQQLQLRSFSLERLLTIYVSLVASHGAIGGSKEVVECSGNTVFLDHIRQFCGSGYLRETTADRSNRTFVCLVGTKTASTIAKGVELSLSEYLRR